MRASAVVHNSSARIASLLLTLALLALSSRLGTADPPPSPPSAERASIPGPRESSPARGTREHTARQPRTLKHDVPATPLFVENVGQFDARARFQARVGRATLWLGDDALWVTLVDSAARDDDGGKSSPAGGPTGPRGVNMKLTFIGMDPRARLVAADPRAATMNYLVGRNPAGWRTLLPTYGAIRWEGIEPGLDLVLRSAPGGVRIAFESASSVRPTSMRLRVDGADALRLDGSGRLVVRIGKSTVELPLSLEGASSANGAGPSEERPWLESREIVLTSPVLSGATAGNDPDVRTEENALDAGAAPPEGLVYSTLLGANSDDGVSAIAVGASGAAYVLGTTVSPGFPTTPGAFDETYNSHKPGFGGDVFLAKLDPAGGRLVWSTFLGGFDTDYGTALALDASGSLYVLGYTYSDDFPTTPGSWSPTFNGGCCDVFLTKLDPTGSRLVYSTFLGGDSFEAAWGLALARNGSVYVTGETLSLDFPTTPGAFDTSYSSPGYSEAYLALLDAGGSDLVYSTFLGGTYNDYGFGVAVGADGAAYVAGETQSFDFPTTHGAFDRRFNGGNSDVFVVKLEPPGRRLAYGTYVGGSDLDGANAIVVDASGVVHLTGHTVSPDFPNTADAFQGRCVSCATFASDVFVTGIEASGATLSYSTFLGGSGTDLGRAIAVGPHGSVYVAGTTFSQNFPITPDALDGVMGGVSDAFVARIEDHGRELGYGTYVGGSGVPGGFSYEWGSAIAVRGSRVWVAGSTGSDNFPTTPGAFDRTYDGQDDAFVTKFLTAERVP